MAGLGAAGATNDGTVSAARALAHPVEVGRVAAEGGQIVGDVVHTMADIESSSRQIGEIERLNGVYIGMLEQAGVTDATSANGRCAGKVSIFTH